MPSSQAAACRRKRALKFFDWGKVAATFVDLQTGRSVRIVAREDSKKRASEMFPALDKEQGQQKAYRVLADEDLFEKQWVRVEIHPEDLPGFKGPLISLRKMRRGNQFQTRSRCQRPHALPRLRRPALLRASSLTIKRLKDSRD